MDDKPFLNDLSLHELKDLCRVMRGLIDAGRVMLDGGIEPRFSLVPGQRPCMALNFSMPQVWRSEGISGLSEGNVRSSDDAADLSEFPAPVSQADVQEIEPGTGGEGLAEAFPAEPDVTSDVSLETAAAGWVSPPVLDPGVYIDVQPSRVVDGPVPGSASAMAKAMPAPWTAQEDELAVTVYVDNLNAGEGIGEAARKAADAVGRPFEGTKFRLKNKLAEQVDARLLRLLNAKALAETARRNAAAAAEVSIEAAPQPIAADPAPDVVAEKPPADADPVAIDPRLRRHISALSQITHGRRWKPAEDLALLDDVTNGLKLAEIAADMGLDSNKVKFRLETLIGSFSAADVLVALKAQA